MIEKTAWDVRKYPEKFAVYRILCNFAVVFQNCINSMEAKYIHRELSAVIEEAYRYFSVITVTGPRQSGKTTRITRWKILMSGVSPKTTRSLF